jgi:D-sedoheptulose 7-phosphate isomerase
MDKKDRQFIDDYFEYYRHILSTTDVGKELLAFTDICRRVKASGNKLIFAGNGASASISSHAATDFTQHAKVRTICFNDHNLITCFANDYGYENWVTRALEAYADEGDVVVLISSSGSSPNVVNAAEYASNKGHQVVTFTGFSPDNPLCKFGKPSFWVDSRAYNVVESTHLIWVLAVANLLEQKGDDKTFFAEHFLRHQQVLFEIDYSSALIQFRNLCRDVSDCGGKMVFAGNGGSSSIASHAAADFTKQSKIRTVAFNDHNLMSAYSNDYGQDQWIVRCIDDYADPEDAVVLLSCSGQSLNVINAARFAKEKGLQVVTFTGFDPGNHLRSLGQINFWVNSNNYNITEAAHTILIFCVGDMLAGVPEYSAGGTGVMT